MSSKPDLRESVGILCYENDPLKLVVKVDQGIYDYYRALLAKHIWTNPQRYPAHISVVRKETPHNMECWGRYEGEEVPFLYEHYIYNSTVYYWLNVFSKRLEEIRLELGLPVCSPYARPLDGYDQIFHCTVGNIKNLDQ